jgi:hypothetical protein
MKINEEVFKKLQDPKFYLENFVKIKGKKPGALLPFILNEAQKDLFNTVNKNDRTIILKARQMGFCVDPEMRILTSDLRWIKVDKINIGEEIVSVDENISGGIGSERRLNTSFIEKKWEIYDEAFEIFLDNDEKLILTGGHKMLCSGNRGIKWKKVDDFLIGDRLRFITRPWSESTNEDCWFGGILDGEATMQNSKRRTSITVYQTEGVVLNRIKNYIKNKNYVCCEFLDNREDGKKKMISITFSRMQDIFKIIGQCRVTRFLQENWWDGRRLPQNGWAKIVKIKSLGKRRMIDLQTSKKTFIVEGFVSHNSTAMVGYIYHKTITTPGTNSAIIGYNSSLTSELLDKVKTFYRTTPSELRPTIFYNSKYEISFPRIDSKIMVLPSTENVGRGYTLHNVLATELSAWDKAEEKMTTLEASVPIGGKIVIESTPRGMGNLYHRMWMSDNDYAKKMYGWWWGYNEEEIEMIRKRLNNPQKFAQEYGCRFLSSGRPVFDYDYIEKQYKNVLRVGDIVGEHIVKEEDGLRIYRPPERDGLYVFGVDVSEGVIGGDYSSVTVWDRKTGEEVAMFRGMLAPDILGEKLDKWGRKYNNALMVVEINNHGLTTVTILRQKTYPSLYFRQVKLETMGVTGSDKIGWRTTKVTRPLLIDDFAQAVRDGILTIHSKELLDEMSVFVYDEKGDAVPQEGFHDDTIFSAGIGIQGFKILYNGDLAQLNYHDHLPKNFSY